MKVLVGSILWLISLASYAEGPTAALKASIERRVEQSVADDSSPFMHAMREPEASAKSARLKINAWIRYNFQQAYEYKSKGDIENALFHYLMARHALRDSTSPTSNDEHGDPAILAAKQVVEHKALSTHSWRDKVDEDTQLMFDHNVVPAGDLLGMYGIDTEKGPVDRPNQAARPVIVKK